LTSASTDTNLLNSIVTLPTPSIISGGLNYYYSDDLFRWGEDGLALLLRDDLGTGGAILYLLRGPFVVPQELNTNTAASITAVSSGTIAAGSGNTLLTLTGGNFVPGVAITWNGNCRTTAIVDATHVTVAIPASDLTAAGTGTLVATNPGAPASSSLTIEVQ
jgi:trimeric autotransporter adhesin